MMKHNVGGWDRGLRTAALIGTLALALSRKAGRGWRRRAAMMAAAETFTVVSRYCPLNQLLGINTSRGVSTKEQKAAREAAQASLPSALPVSQACLY